MVSNGPLGWDAPLPPRPRRFSLWPIALVLVAVLVLAAAIIRLPYEVVSPGGANDLHGLVTITGSPTHEAKGTVLFVTVGVRDRVSAFELLRAWASPDRDFYRLKDIHGNLTSKQIQQLNTALMSDSKLLAEGVALRHAGPGAPKPVGAEVSVVVPDRPASAFMKVHDVIVGVDGKATPATDCAVKAIRAHKPGDKISLVYNRDGRLQAAEATLADGPQHVPLLGVQLETKFGTGFSVKIDSGIVSGPSAGLAYALQLLDLLTPGELTGGAKVAATGELRSDGTGAVDPIGGEAEKAVTVRRAGASLFIVPRVNYAKAKAHAGNVRVEPVDTFQDALRVLATLPGSNAAQYLQPSSPC
jgi:PDZ domain-containing protein